jgi:hypothetical protein
MPYPSASEIFKLIKTGATIEAQEKIMELRQSLMDLQEENLDLRAKVQSLETRVRELDGAALPRCPRCGKPAWSLKESHRNPHMGVVGGFRRKYVCDQCSFTEDRLEKSTP